MSSAYFADITNQLYYYWKTKKIATACWSFCSTLLPHIKESQYQVTVDTVFENHRKTLIHYCELKLAVKQYYQTGTSVFIKKLVANAKIKKKSKATFYLIFKQCECYENNEKSSFWTKSEDLKH